MRQAESQTGAAALPHDEAAGPGFAADPHVRERGVLVEAPDAETGTLPMHAPFPRLSRTPGAIRRQAPALGQDKADILGPLVGAAPSKDERG